MCWVSFLVNLLRTCDYWTFSSCFDTFFFILFFSPTVKYSKMTPSGSYVRYTSALLLSNCVYVIGSASCE